MENAISWVDRDRLNNLSWRGDSYYRRVFYSGLLDMVNSIDNHEKMKMFEIGTFQGESTELFALTFEKVVTIDPYDLWAYTVFQRGRHIPFIEIENYFIENVLNKYPNIEKVKGFSTEVSKLQDNNSVDFVYIDADHRYEYVKNDILSWLPKIKKNGYIGGHDYDQNRFPGVCSAVSEFFNDVKIFDDTSWLVKVL